MKQELKSRLNKAATVFPRLMPEQVAAPGPTRSSKAKNSNPGGRLSKGFAPERPGNVKSTVLSVENMSSFGSLYVDFLRVRRQVFVEDKGWGLPVVDGMEFDQYDTPFSRWIVIHEHGEILAGVRLIPTTAQCGIYSYMLRDAQLGLLDQIPPDILLVDAPVKKEIWEASRMFISANVPAHRRLVIQSILMADMVQTARELGATHVIGIVPAVWSRWLRRMDFQGFACGPRMKFGKDRSQAVLLKVVDQTH